METIKNELTTYISENFFIEDDVKFNDDTSFLETGIIDSTGIVEYVDYVETQFIKTEVETEEITPENFDSINRTINFIKSKALKV